MKKYVLVQVLNKGGLKSVCNTARFVSGYSGIIDTCSMIDSFSTCMICIWTSGASSLAKRGLLWKGSFW